ncbi:MAG: AI-2E family transporter [Gammaproteobacteria bacterium]|nr:MAG: AI-2E family transporter [Gammaproteobacteria bacterium]
MSESLSPTGHDQLSKTLEATLRIGAVLLLIAWCLTILSPFLLPIVWAGIIAVALYPAFLRLAVLLGDRQLLAGVVTTLLLLLLLIVPMILLGETLVDTALELGKRVRDGSLVLPPPPDNVAGWPLIGPPLAEFWALASKNLQAALSPLLPYLKPAAGWLVSTGTGAGLGLLQSLAAILIAGVMLVWSATGKRIGQALIGKLAGTRGTELADLVEKTVRGVAAGILGVAIIQALLSGLGMLAAGVPGAGLWTLVALIACVVQIGPGLVLVPAVIYLFSFGETTTAVAFLIWSVVVMLLDNVLKPLLMGRGVKAPIAVLFVGAIGGLLTMGIVGLFVGAVVLVIGYTLLMAWLGLVEEQTVESTDQGT